MSTRIQALMQMPVGTDRYIKGIDGNAFHRLVSEERRHFPELSSIAFKTETAFGGIIVTRMPDRIFGRSGDKYGIKSLEVNEERFAKDGDRESFSKYLYTMRQRHEELRLRKFQAVECDGGVIVRRLA